MERRIEKKCENHMNDFKNSITNWIESNSGNIIDTSKKEDFLKFISEYESMKISKEDLTHTKRNRCVVSECERCNANRANGERCTRRKQSGQEYCGTHEKGQPHGSIEKMTELNKEEIYIKESKGIYYYEDKAGVKYKTEDILKNLKDPKVIKQ